jgi:hypothetical protein
MSTRGLFQRASLDATVGEDETIVANRKKLVVRVKYLPERITDIPGILIRLISAEVLHWRESDAIVSHKFQGHFASRLLIPTPIRSDSF